MAQNVYSIIAEAVSQLDSAFNSDPNQDFNAKKAEIIAEVLPSADSQMDVLVLAALAPDVSFSDPSEAANDAHDTMEAMIQSALDSELYFLQNQ